MERLGRVEQATQSVMLAPQATDDTTIAQGREALQRLRSRRIFDDWICVGRAIVLLRDQALRAAGTSRPYGRAYVSTYSALLERHGFNTVTSDARMSLLRIIENLDKVEQWRSTLPDAVRADLNHPSGVWRHYLKAQRPAGDRPRDLYRPDIREQHAAAPAVNTSSSGRHFTIFPECQKEAGRRKLIKALSLYGTANPCKLVEAVLTGALPSEDDVRELLAFQAPRARGNPQHRVRPQSPSVVVLDSTATLRA